jgi:hypothetical protein
LLALIPLLSLAQSGEPLENELEIPMSTSASTSTTGHILPSPTQADPQAAFPARSLPPQYSARVGFAQPQYLSGPMFGDTPQGKVAGYYHRPPYRPIAQPGPPPRPNPTLPDPHYSRRSDEQLAQMLLDNFNAFKGPWPSREVTRQSLGEIARQELTGNPRTDANIKLARELQRRPGLMEALDRDRSTGATNNRFSKADIRNFVHSDNPLKRLDNKQLVEEVLRNFDALKGGWWNRDINLNHLQALANKPLTGIPQKDYPIQLANAVMGRSDVKDLMDNVFGSQRDNKISREELRRLLALLG